MFKKILSLMLLPLLLLLVACNDSSDDESSAPPADNNNATCSLNEPLTFPFEYEFGIDNKMYLLGDGDAHLTEFSAWGSTAYGHTGHLEGDGKTNMSIYLQPTGGQLVELSSFIASQNDDDGLCEQGELCGLNAADAKAASPWWIAKNNNLKLTSVVADPVDAQQQFGTYADETMAWTLSFSLCEYSLAMGHIGDLSVALKSLLEARFGSAIYTAPETIDFSSLGQNPIVIPKETLLARPQITYSVKETINNEVIYFAHADMEWGFGNPDDNGYTNAYCGMRDLEPNLKNQFQGAMEANLIKPQNRGRLVGYQEASSVDAVVASQNKVCNVNTLAGNVYNKIAMNDSRAWHDNLMTYQTKRQILSVWQVNKDNSVYQSLGASLYDSSNVNYMLAMAFDGSPSTLTLDHINGLDSVDTESIYTQVLNLTPGTDTPANTHLILKIQPSYSQAGSQFANKYVSLRYSLRNNHMVYQWGPVADSENDAVNNLPAAIPTNVTCNGSPYFCVDHDFTSMYQ